MCVRVEFGNSEWLGGALLTSSKLDQAERFLSVLNGSVDSRIQALSTDLVTNSVLDRGKVFDDRHLNQLRTIK